MTAEQTDAQLWAAVVRGDGIAFASVFDRHGDRVWRHVWRIMQHRQDAEDVVSATFAEAWRKRASVRIVDDSLLPWLLVTATNCARNAGRSRRRLDRLFAHIPRADAAPDAPDEAIDVSTFAADPPHPPLERDCASDPSPLGPLTVLEREPVDPLAGPLAGTARSGLELVTFDAYGLVVVAVLETADVDAGCLELDVPVAGGSVRASMPFQTDAPGLISERYADRRLPVGSDEHRVIVEVLGTLRISGLGTP